MIIGIIVSVVTIITAICIIVGLYKGFSNTKSWALEYVLTAVLTIFVYSLVDFENDILNISLVFGTAIVLLLLFAFIFALIRRSITRKIADTRLYHYYETYGDREQNILEIRDAIERGDKKLYKQLTKRKMKEKTGACGVVDRIFGILNMFVKGFVVCSMIVIVALLLLQFTQLSFVTEGGALYSVYTSGIWQFLSPYVLDLIILAILQFTIRASYRSGLLNALFVLVVLALIAGAGYVAYWLAFRTDAFISLAAGTGWQFVAQIAITAVLFIIEFIVIIILAVIAGRAISNAREAKAVSVVDGVLGSIIFTVIVAGILLFVGMFLYSFHDFAIMDILNSYCTTVVDGETHSSVMFSCLYNNNPLNDVEVFANLQSTIAGFFNK